LIQSRCAICTDQKSARQSGASLTEGGKSLPGTLRIFPNRFISKYLIIKHLLAYTFTGIVTRKG